MKKLILLCLVFVFSNTIFAQTVKEKTDKAKAKTEKTAAENKAKIEKLKAEKTKATTQKTWVFNAENVRDFAFGSSRKFIWDALAANVEGKKVMCMSAYGKEAYGLYRKFSTKSIPKLIELLLLQKQWR